MCRGTLVSGILSCCLQSQFNKKQQRMIKNREAASISRLKKKEVRRRRLGEKPGVWGEAGGGARGGVYIINSFHKIK